MAKKTILVIDDEAGFVDVVKMRLEANDFKIISAYDGETGLEKARRELPDLILLDLVMPKLNGFDVLVKLKHDPHTANIPVIILTAKSETEHIMEAENLGATDYIIKPASMQVLLDLISKHLS